MTLSFVIFVIFVIFLAGKLFKTARLLSLRLQNRPPPPYTPYFTVVPMPVYPHANACLLRKKASFTNVNPYQNDTKQASLTH